MEKTRNVEFDKEVSLKLYIGLVLRKWLLKEKNTIKETLLWSALEQLEMCPGTSPIRSSIWWRWKLICKERASAENVTKRAPLWENSWVGCFFKDHHIEATPVWGGRLHFQLAAEPGSTVCLYGTDLTGKNDTRMGYQRGLCQGSWGHWSQTTYSNIRVSAKKHQELTVKVKCK